MEKETYMIDACAYVTLEVEASSPQEAYAIAINKAITTMPYIDMDKFEVDSIFNLSTGLEVTDEVDI